MVETVTAQHQSRTLAPTETAVAPMAASREWKDVWSRIGSRYRIRAIVLLGVNLLLFAGVGSFAFWLRTGEWFAPTLAGYADTLKQTFWSFPLAGGAGGGTALGTLLLEPISVQDVPMQIVIVGLLMAALISIPILVSLIYRLWSSLPFVGVVGFLAVMPWLAVALAGSCVLASWKPVRSRYRFVSALTALIPTVVYLTLAWSGTTEALAGKIDPIDRIKFVAPWVLAIVAAALVCAVVLALARLVDYRPGAITPLLAVMLGLPVALFELRVGRDELYYRLLETASADHFTDVDTSAELDQRVQEAWMRDHGPRRSLSAVRERIETAWLFELASDVGQQRSALTRHQAEIVAQCDDFYKHFPHSRYVPNSLFIKARALDMRVDPAEFKRSAWIRFYDDFPSPASRNTWRLLSENCPDTTLGDVALLKLAQLDARDGDVERAVDKLATLLADLARNAAAREPQQASAATLRSVLTTQSPQAALGVSVERINLQAHQLLGLLVDNRDPIYGYDPICGPRMPGDVPAFGLLDLDPRHERYLDNLRRLRSQYPNCQIADNLDLEIAKATPSIKLRIELLQQCLNAFPRRDATKEVLFRLGITYKTDGQRERSEEIFDRLTREYPSSIWARQAARYTSGRTRFAAP